MATLGNGYVYHTPLDDPSYIPTASIAQLGRSVISAARAFLQALAEQDEADEQNVAPTTGGVSGKTHEEGKAAPTRTGSLRGPLNRPHSNAQIIPEGAGVVFFDYLGLAWITYDRATANLLHLGESAESRRVASRAPSFVN